LESIDQVNALAKEVTGRRNFKHFMSCQCCKE